MLERGGGPPDGGDDFGARLETLKDSGCAVLVTGKAPRAIHADICRRLLGAADNERRRVLVFANGTYGLEDRLPAGGQRADSRVILAGATRSAAVESGSQGDVDLAETGDAALDAIGVAIVEACRDLDDRFGPFEPAELRVGLDSLCPLLDAHGEQAVFQFLTVLTRYLRVNDALGHAHLPVDRNDEAVRLLGPLFDALVEVRAGDGTGQHRWHLDDGDLTSRWLPI